MTAKEFLEQIPHIDARIKALIEQQDRHRYYASKGTGTLSAVRYGGTADHSKVEHGALKVIELEKQIGKLVIDLVTLKAKALAYIDMLYDQRQRDILTWRYLNGWEWKQVIECLEVERMQVWRIHDTALHNVKLMIDYYQ